MRTTLTIDDDVAAKLVSASRKSGLSFKEVVNSTLRRGLMQAQATRKAERFSVESLDLGSIRSGATLEKISAVLDEIDGPDRR